MLARFPSFLWLNNIPLCACLNMCVFMYYTFFIHSSISGHLGSFYILVIVNNVAMSTELYISFQVRVFVFFGYSPV